MTNTIIFRKLTSSDALAYKALRVQALTGKDAGFFFADPKTELSYAVEQWRQACAETCSRAMFGAFDGRKLIGAVSACLWENDETGKTAYFRSMYVLPENRDDNVTRGLCVRHDQWAKTQGCTSAVYVIRADNDRWIEKQIALGARPFQKENLRFADGSRAPALWFRRSLVSEP